VKQGVKIPIQTTINNTISVQFIDVTLRLTVTPQITADNTVFMDIDVENTAIDPGIPRINGIPALDTQSATTQVLVNDGGTVVIGGVIISSQRTDVSQVPLFGSIPLIGHLFKRTSVSTSSQELLFFLTPRIVPQQ
jgi:type IV pilus assembly protein PilQ